MSNLKSLEARLEAAFEGLEARLAAPFPDGPEDPVQVAQLQAENKALSDQVELLTQRRDEDLAQLDALLEQLRPLIEESA
ncbi:MAG: hypothetical protein AAGB10_04400 [Pseudomonadota bacterium]